MSKILMVIAPQKFRDEEFLYPKEVFEKHDFTVKVASLEKEESVGVQGTKVMVDMKVEEVNIDDFVAVVFVGGEGILDYLEDPRLTGLARDFFFNQEKIVAAICAAPGILAYAGILKGKRATSYSGVRDILEKSGAIFMEKGVVVDGTVVTADGPASAKQFGETVVDEINKKLY